MSFRERFARLYGDLIPEVSGKITCDLGEHSDSSPSLHLDYETGKYHCYSCGKSGHVEDLLADTKVIDPSFIDGWHKDLMESPHLDWLMKTKGYSREAIESLKIGFNGTRYVYPVRNGDGEYINVRLYSPTGGGAKIVNYGRGYGGTTWFPHPPKEDLIFVFEGESDCTLARSIGIKASYTSTSGCKSWTDDMTTDCRGRRVVVCYDTDNAGRVGATKVVNAIKFAVTEVKTIILPTNHKNKSKDFSDWILKDGGSKQVFETLVADTCAHLRAKGEISLKDASVISLITAYKSEWANKPIQCNAVIAGKDRSPYIVPFRIQVECQANGKGCANCSGASGRTEFQVDWQNGQLIKFVDATEDGRDMVMKKMFGLSLRCTVARINVLEHQDIERVALIPYRTWYDVDDTASTPDQSLRSGYYLGTGVKSNTAYVLTGIMMPNPIDQSGVFLVSEAMPLNQQEEEADLKLAEMFRLDKEDNNGIRKETSSGL